MEHANRLMRNSKWKCCLITTLHTPPFDSLRAWVQIKLGLFQNEPSEQNKREPGSEPTGSGNKKGTHVLCITVSVVATATMMDKRDSCSPDFTENHDALSLKMRTG